jgi:hypothetical protein
MPGDLAEDAVSRQQHQLMADAELCQERIDRFDWHALLAVLIAERCSGNVVLAVRHDQRKIGKSSTICSCALGPLKPCSNS